MMKRFISLVLGGMAALWAGPAPALSALETTGKIHEAISAIGLTPKDLRFKKDIFPDPNISPLVKTLLDDPVRTLEAAEDLEKEWSRPLWEGETLSSRKIKRSSVSVTDWKEVPIEARLPIQDLLAALSFFRERVAVVFSGMPQDLKSRALGAYALETFHLEKDPEAKIFWQKESGFQAGIEEWQKKAGNFSLGETELIRPQLQAAYHLSPLWFERECRSIAAEIRTFDRVMSALVRVNPEKFSFHLHQIETEWGRILIGGLGSNRYSRRESDDAWLMIDFGGDDTYEEAGCTHLSGGHFSIAIDLSGNDVYRSAGSGIFGLGLLWDSSGDDRYTGRNATFGAGLFGAGCLIDLDGNDSYSSDTLSQGAGAFGCGLLWDGGGNDVFGVALFGQGFAGVKGFGVLADAGGDDRYLAGQKYVDYDHYPDHFLSMSQGFAMGYRPFAPGGVGLLVDLKGNDRYEADVYGQGASYWYSFGGLIDGEGDDRYHLCEYGQGSGIHLSIGFLKDGSGHDRYSADKGLVQGAAHDFAVGLLWEGGGNDAYQAESGSQGAALNNAAAFLIDLAGNDSYRLRQKGHGLGQGFGGYSPRRGIGSVGVLMEIGGTDEFSFPKNKILSVEGSLGVRADAKDPEELSSAKKIFKENGWAGPVDRMKTLWGKLCDKILNIWEGSGGLLSRGKFGFGSWKTQVPSYEPASIETILSNGGDRSLGILLMKGALYGDTPEKVLMRSAALKELESLAASRLPGLLPWAALADVTVYTLISEECRKKGTNSLPYLRKVFADSPREVRALCLYHFGEMGDPEDAVFALKSLDHARLRPAALLTLSKLGAKSNETKILPWLKSTRELERTLALRVLSRSAYPKQTIFYESFEDPDWNVRNEALMHFQKVATNQSPAFIPGTYSNEIKKLSPLGKFWAEKLKR